MHGRLLKSFFFCVFAIKNHKSNLTTNANCLSILHKNLQLETAEGKGNNLGLRVVWGVRGLVL